MRVKRLTALRALEAVLLVTGIACTMGYVWTTHEIRRHQDESRRALARIVVEPRATADDESGPSPELTAADARVLGQLDIPRVRLSAPVLDTDDDDAMGFAVGYLPDTPPPWRSGNTVIAAHRDGLFRPLEDVRAGDTIRLTTRHGDLQYQVLRTLVVQPDDVWVLGQLDGVDLTLITCFPFTYVGHAPKRFIVQAAKVPPRVQ